MLALTRAQLFADIGTTALADLITPPHWLYMTTNPLTTHCEVLTEEYVDALAHYLHVRLRAILAAAPPPGEADAPAVTVLEVGAGNGRLTYHLRERVRALMLADRDDISSDGGGDAGTAAAARARRVRFVATDLRGNTADAAAAVRLAVKPLGHVAALEQYRPAVVLAAWMNKDEDWTAAIAATASVHEYVLIGERDYGVSGTSDGTWGLARPGSPVALAVPRWRAEGFVRMDLERLSLLQVCRTDSPAVRFHCKTVVFRRGRLAADAPPPDRAKAEL